MARKPTPPTKSETLSIRLDPKTRFVLEYLSRLRGQTITTVVERAIVSAASQAPLREFQSGVTFGWQDLWDVSDGVRALRIASERDFFPTFEEEKRLAFAKEHWPFFYHTQNAAGFINHFVDVLWPRIDEFVQMHDDMRATDYFAAGHAMQEALKTAQLKAPEWPVKPKAEPKTKGGGFSRDLDDEIPF